MRITFCGAARTVTGSCYLVECANIRFLVDCGMFQGSDENIYERDSFPFNPADISFVLLTHAHIDHSGRLPLLLKKGFSGKIYSTSSTRKLSEIMLLDSAHIQEMEAEWGYKKAKRGSGKAYKPLYDTIDAAKCSKKFVSVPYGKIKKAAPSVSFRFQDAGHLLGSCHIEVWLKEDGVERKIVFSGDIGNRNQPIIKDPTFISEADFVVCESTYGDKFHSEDSSRLSSLDRAKNLALIIHKTFFRGGNLIIPAFAVGRTQEILYLLYLIHKKKLLDYNVPTFIDSPLGIKATDIFSASSVECYDQEAKNLVAKGENILHFPTLLVAETQDESQKINSFPDPCVIISSSGMCNAGRIKHHLKYNLWRPESTVLFTGYQAVGTLGRMIVDGAKSVRIFGDMIDVKAEILTTSALSGHADQKGILDWVNAFDKKKLKQVFVVHGEDKNATFFAGFLNRDYGIRAYAPSFGESFDLLDFKGVTTEYQAFEADDEKLKIDSSVKVLDGQLKALADIVGILKQTCADQNLQEKKKVRKLVNKALYLSSDIEELVSKWKGMV